MSNTTAMPGGEPAAENGAAAGKQDGQQAALANGAPPAKAGSRVDLSASHPAHDLQQPPGAKGGEVRRLPCQLCVLMKENPVYFGMPLHHQASAAMHVGGGQVSEGLTAALLVWPSIASGLRRRPQQR